MSYESPIEFFGVGPIMKAIRTSEDIYALQAIAKIGVNVDKAELIKALEYDRGQYEKGYIDGVFSARAEWISVNDALPEEPLQTVIVTDGKDVYIGVYSIVDKVFGVMCGRDNKCNVTHWMPLPEPPESEEGQNE